MLASKYVLFRILQGSGKGTGDEGEVAGRSHDDAPIADWERAAASATFVTDSIALFKRQDRRGLKEVL